MMISAIDDSQRKAARVAGLTYIASMATVVFGNLGVHDRLIVVGNVAETARNIMAHERLFRVGIACDVIYSVGLIVLLTALYVILRPVNRNLALLAALFRLVYAVVWVLMAINLFEVLRLLSGADYLGVTGANYLRVFETDRLQALARLNLTANFDMYYVGLLFFALASTVCSYLWLRSSYIPKALAAFGLVSSAWCAFCALALFIFPDFSKVVNLWWFDSPLGVFEIVLGFLLLFRGLRSSGIAERA